MDRQLRRKRLTYANVASTLALLVALSGTAYAAAGVTSRDIVNRTIKLQDMSLAARSDLLPWVAANGDADAGTISGSSSTTVEHVDLPVGFYLVTGKLWLRNASTAKNVNCVLTTGTEDPYIFTDIEWVSLAATGSPGSSLPMSFEVVAWERSAGTVAITCNPHGGTVHVFDVKLTVIPIRTFSVNYN